MNKNNKGFIKFIVIIIVSVLVLSYLNFDLRSFLDSPMVKNNFDFLWGIGQYIWQNFILYPIDVILGKIVSVIPKR